MTLAWPAKSILNHQIPIKEQAQILIPIRSKALQLLLTNMELKPLSIRVVSILSATETTIQVVELYSLELKYALLVLISHWSAYFRNPTNHTWAPIQSFRTKSKERKCYQETKETGSYQRKPACRKP
jgi:hypothetical protein